jgi:hypothetical protein
MSNIRAGAYGWCHSAWLNGFYPDDLPVGKEEDWRLAYYSNEFNTVLVPADYWLDESGRTQFVDCEQWLEDVNDDFQFNVECHASMFVQLSFDEIAGQLKKLQPKLSALIVPEDWSQVPKLLQGQFCDLADLLMVDVFTDNRPEGTVLDIPVKNIWRQKGRHDSNLAVFDDDLTDLRLARTIVDDFMSQVSEMKQNNHEATIIVSHPELRAGDLSQFRTVLEIMGG